MSLAKIKNKNLTLILLIACLFFFGHFILIPQALNIPQKSHSGELLGSERYILSEFSLVLVDYFFLAADAYWRAGRWYYVPYFYGGILKIQPEFRDVWSLLGWFYAFNWSLELSDPEKSKQAIERGLAILEKGLEHHTDSYHLYFDLAWIYYKRTQDYVKTLEHLKTAEQFPHPMAIEKLKALSLFHLNQKEAAEAVWLDYLEKNPGNHLGQHELSKLRKAMNETVVA